MIFQWLFGKKSSEPGVLAAWSAVRAKKLLLNAEAVIAKAVISYTLKAEIIADLPRLDDTVLKKRLRHVFDLEKRALGQEDFEEKNLDKAIHLLLNAITVVKARGGFGQYSTLGKQELVNLGRISTVIKKWHENLEAQYSWLRTHSSIADIRKNIKDFQALVAAEGRIIFGLKNVELANAVKKVKEIIDQTNYPATSKMQSMLLKKNLRIEERDWTEFFHAYPPGPPHPLLSGALLSVARAATSGGFFMAKDPEVAKEVLRSFLANPRLEPYFIRVLIHRKAMHLVIELPEAFGTYYVIKIVDFPAANDAIKKGLIRFMKV